MPRLENPSVILSEAQRSRRIYRRADIITKKDFETIKDVASREDSFDWDIPNGYILFRKIGMTVCRLKKGTWYTKHVNFWQDMSYTQLMEKLREQEWEEDK